MTGVDLGGRTSTRRRGADLVCAVVALGAASGCNWFFDVSATVLVDAQYFDAPIDAPFTCPAGGPRFGRNLVQVLAQDCGFYSESLDVGLAVAVCRQPGADNVLAMGELNGGFVAPVSLAGEDNIRHARITPEGDELWLARGSYGIRVYRRDASSTWVFARDLSSLGFAPDAVDGLATPSRRSDGQRRVVIYSFVERVLFEFVDDGTATTLVTSYTPQSLGVWYIQYPNLSADGLRLVFVGEPMDGSAGTSTMYAERARVSDPFGPAVVLDAPTALDPYLREDCSRLYSSGLSVLFFAPQQL